jgi:hypothetical protein
MKTTVPITKASGKQEPFSEVHLRQSLQRSGARPDVIDEVVQQVAAQLYPGITTHEIYRTAFGLLKKHARPVAAKYKLKQAIMELGPSGYPFEKYVAEILKFQGYAVKTGQLVAGHCVTHEIDVVAEKGEHHFMVECKYHNRNGVICDVKIPLYIQARFQDVEKQWKLLPGHSEKFHQGWVVTNTRFSEDAVKYGNCIGLRLIGWNYPEGQSLRNLIDRSGLYPITCLTTLTRLEKQRLLDSRIVLCKELCANHDLLLNAGVQQSRMRAVLNEAHTLCEGQHP